MLERSRVLFLSLALVGLTLISLAGCGSPDAVGVQDAGQITGRVVSATNQMPIQNALVSVGIIAQHTDQGGGFNLNAPVGPQTVSVSAAGYLTTQEPVQVSQTTPVVLTISLNPTL